jgi:hypothetical protein
VIEATGVRPVGEHAGWIGQVHRRRAAAIAYSLKPQKATVVRGMVLGDLPSSWRSLHYGALNRHAS